MRKNRRRLLLLPGLAAAVLISLTGCSTLQEHGYLPGFVAGQQPVTNHTQRVSDLWVGSWIVGLLIGFVTWGLIIAFAIAYRRRRGQTGLPLQIRYNMPIEIFYTLVPVITVLGLFAFTARDQQIIETRTQNPDVTVQVFGKQWAWDFNYVKENVYSAGVQAVPAAEGTPRTGFVESAVPQLVLPVNKTVELQLRTRDVNHSFWVIDFLYKKDLIAGQTNYMDFTPTRTGTYAGKCAELCGEYHSRMLFTVKVVTPAEYTAYIQQLRSAGNVGQLGTNLNKDDNSAAVGSQDSGVPAGSETNRRGGNDTSGLTGSGK
ncbi:cytochrome c oxidase subunit II [Amnibacterium sp. CER49]|uniref:aa3-type cytochrome oxidase subunit II n=1 Tax=Amnibacterium sp. CER49 TaxID=3039161 RepID=UPI002446EAD6|nr:cytochrome c oxidase subunit II [Amnibacterium sp. CER49]MDH2444687.1 cytochrome c oxidase subunit II [Amnibacterium sp. CER49]